MAKKTPQLWLALLVAAIAAASCCTYEDVGDGPVDDLVKALVGVVVRRDADKTVVALRQLRQIGKTHPLTPRVMKPLVVGWRQYGKDGFDASLDCPAARALAAGGPGTDRLLLEELRAALGKPDGRVAFLLFVLALAEHPSAEVTEQLAELAGSEGTAPPHRMLFALALAARGDHSKDWIGEVAQNVLVPADEARLTEYVSFMIALCYTIPKLEGTPALVENLWRTAIEGSVRGPNFMALIPYALVERKPPDPARVQQLRSLLTRDPSGQYMLKAMVHLAIARLGVDRKDEVREALALISRLSGFMDGVILHIVQDTLVDEGILSEMQQETLSTDSRELKEGVLILAGWMGPDAKSMLPALEKLVSDADPRIATEARKARVLVAGLDSEGEWLFKQDADLIMKLSPEERIERAREQASEFLPSHPEQRPH